MSARIGVAVGRGAVRAIAMRNDRIVWAGEAPLPASDDLQRTIAGLLALAPLPRWPRPIVHGAIGPHGAQVKRVVGLPDIVDPESLAAIVREAAGTYFLKNGVALLTTGVRPAGAGAAVAAALDQPYVDAIRAASHTRGLRVGPIAPTAIALLGSFVDASFRWNDGSLTIEVTRTGHQLDALRTRPAVPDDDATTTAATVPALAALGADSLRYADAYGAAVLDAREPLAVQSRTDSFFKIAAPRRALALSAAMFAAGVVIVGLSPLAAKWAGDRALANIAAVRPGRWQVISSSLAQLDRVSTQLTEARAFGDSRTSVGALLGDIARLLPPNSAVLAFDWSDQRGEITVVTDNPSVVLSALRRLPGIAAVELVGSVTRQSVGTQELQRITVRFARKA